MHELAEDKLRFADLQVRHAAKHLAEQRLQLSSCDSTPQAEMHAAATEGDMLGTWSFQVERLGELKTAASRFPEQ